MPGPLPLVPENTKSSYGQEAEIQNNISSASQYNPATKLGITAEDQPSKRAIPGATSKQILGKSPMDTEPAKIGAPLDKLAEPPKEGEIPKALPAPPLHQHFQKLAALPNASPEIKYYASHLPKE